MKVVFGGNWMKTHQKVYKLASSFLQYPQKEWITNLSELKQEMNKMKDSSVNAYLNSFIHYLETTPFRELCEKYVKTFDFHGIACLNLTYHVFKDSRERGQALVKLRQLFKESELMIESDELPDYLPLILEFLAIADEKHAKRILKLHLNSIKKLEERLSEKKSPYHFLIKATVDVSSEIMNNKNAS